MRNGSSQGRKQRPSASAPATITGTSAKLLSFTWRSKRREVFDLLPRELSTGSNQQQERFGLSDFLGELGQPEARAQRDRGKKTCAVGSIRDRPERTAWARAVSLELNDRNIRTLPNSEPDPLC